MYYLSFEYKWNDEDLIDLEIVVKSKCFDAKTRVYTTREELQIAAEKIKGFPQKSDDKKTFKIGSENAYGNIICLFRTFNTTGRCKVLVNITGRQGYNDEEGKAEIPLIIFPNDIDILYKELIAISESRTRFFEIQGIE